MTLNVDPRAGSNLLIQPLTKAIGSVNTFRMHFGDVAFIGKGEEGAPIPVGIEYKKLGDLLQCMKDDRFTRHQLPGLRDCYEDIWLIVEGEWEPHYARRYAHPLLYVRHKKGTMGPLPGRGRQQIPYRRFAKYLISLEIRGGVRMVHTTSLGETVEFIAALYHWWTFAPLEAHTSHVQASMKRGFTDHTGFLPAPISIKMLAQVSGIGKTKAEAILAHFGTLRAALDATPAMWEKVPGIGGTLYRGVYAALNYPYIAKEMKHGTKRQRHRVRSSSR